MRLSPDARLSLALLSVSLAALGAFLWLGFGSLPPRQRVDSATFSMLGPSKAETTFEEVTEAVGLGEFRHDTDGLYSIEQAMSPGLGLLDLDFDFDLDLVLLGGAGNPTGVSIYRNRLIHGNRLAEDRTVQFEDVTQAAGVVWTGQAQGVCAGDYDNDGDVDLFVTALGPNLLLQNQLAELQGAALRFRDATAEAGVAGGRYHYVPAPSRLDPVRLQPGPPPASRAVADGSRAIEVPEFSTGASFGDYDLDGDLDLVVANYVGYVEDARIAETPDRNEPLPFLPRPFPGQHDRLYRNEGTGTFRDVSREMGLDRVADKGLTAIFLQLDFPDPFPDLYVANDVSPNRAWLNQQATPDSPGRRLVDRSTDLHLEDLRSGMGIARGDPDADGDLDLLVTNWRHEPASLFLLKTVQPGAGQLPVEFTEESHLLGIGEATEPLVGWGTVFFDYDNDGDADLLIVNGGTSPVEIDSPVCALERPLLFRNLGGRFTEVTGTAGEVLNRSYSARGCVTGDIDRDGDLDVVFSQNNGPVVVLENRLEEHLTEGPGSAGFVLRLDSTTIESPGVRRGDAIGAGVLLFLGNRVQIQEVVSGGSYLSQGPFSLHFGLSPYPMADLVRILWPLAPRGGQLVTTQRARIEATQHVILQIPIPKPER